MLSWDSYYCGTVLQKVGHNSNYNNIVNNNSNNDHNSNDVNKNNDKNKDNHNNITNDNAATMTIKQGQQKQYQRQQQPQG